MSTELKPCPFCGSSQIYRKTTIRSTTIWCNICGAKMSRGYVVERCASLKEAEEKFGYETNEAWNRRVSDENQ